MPETVAVTLRSGPLMASTLGAEGETESMRNSAIRFFFACSSLTSPSRASSSNQARACSFCFSLFLR
jgi:hypothetical protein